jgi:hypothetical protein
MAPPDFQHVMNDENNPVPAAQVRIFSDDADKKEVLY